MRPCSPDPSPFPALVPKPGQDASAPAPSAGCATHAMDIDRALRLWKEAAVYRKFLRKFVRDYRQCVGEMQGSERAHARARAHKLRGAAGSLVLEGIFQAAKALEYSLAGGLPVEGAYAALQQALDRPYLAPDFVNHEVRRMSHRFHQE